MRVLVVNNFVRKGSGTDAFVAGELRALTARGHDVLVFRRDNREFDEASGPRRAALLAASLYSLPARFDMERLLRRERVDVVHLHNLVPSLTGAVYDACRRHGVPTVQHLHNYRAFCLSSYAYRDGHHCDDCSPTAFVACALHRCYRDSCVASAGLVAARWVDWSRGRRSGYEAGSYIANSDFTRSTHVEHGLSAEAVQVLYNPAEDLAPLVDRAGTSAGTRAETRAGDAVPQARLTFVGSLIAAKGAWVALDLAAALPEFGLHFVGTGADEQALTQAARRRGLANVTFHGLLTGAAKVAVWANSFLTLVPSLWNEPFGLVVPESYSLGVPVLATTNGGLAETVVDGETGYRLDVHRIDEAAARVRGLWEDRPRYLALRAAARAAYDSRFTEEAFARSLEKLLLEAAGRRPGATEHRRTTRQGLSETP
jgi:glycosyltransferase involved in cell wall biosynthesis